MRELHRDPTVEIHPDTAAKEGIKEGDWVLIESPRGKVRQRAKLFSGIDPRVVSAEHAWWFPEQPGPHHGWRNSCANLLFGHEHFDPNSGAESLKSAVCRIERI